MLLLTLYIIVNKLMTGPNVQKTPNFSFKLEGPGYCERYDTWIASLMLLTLVTFPVQVKMS